MDVTSKTVTASTMLSGTTALDKAGNSITGTYVNGGNTVFQDIYERNYSAITSSVIESFFNTQSYIPSYAFYSWKASSLKAVVNSSTIKRIGECAFYGAEYITTAKMLSATTINHHAFANASRLYTVSFSNCTSIGSYAFGSCTNIRAIGSQCFPLVTFIDSNAFHNCNTISYASFPALISISSSAFYSCTSLISFSAPLVTHIGQCAFQSCAKLEYADFPLAPNITANVFSGCSALSMANFPSATYIGPGAFSGCTLLTSVTAPLVSLIQNNAFCNCSSLSYLYFSNLKTLDFYALEHATGLKTLILSGPSLLIKYYAFSNCTALESIYLLYSTVPSFNTDTSPFPYTPIANSSYLGYYGSIYVPSSLYDSYLTASVWKGFSSRFVSLTDAEIEALNL